jgi:hypothetical protein
MKVAACAAALSLLLLAACGGHSTTTPTSLQNQFAVDVVLDPFSAGFVLAASVSLDGQEIGRTDWSSLGGCNGPCLVQGAQGTVPAPGHHTVTVTILRESAPVIDYNVQGNAFVTTADTNGTIPLPLQTGNLKPGDSVTYDIQI